MYSIVAKLRQWARLLEEFFDLAGAEALQREVLEARERTLGPDHPKTLTTKGNLARDEDLCGFLMLILSNFRKTALDY